MSITDVRPETDVKTYTTNRYTDSGGSMIAARGVSWGAVFAGGAVGIVFQIWLAMLGVAIGASTIDPLKEAHPMSGIGVGSGIWLLITIVTASIIGGWVTGRLAARGNNTDSATHGAITWAITNLAMMLAVGTLVGGIFSGVARVTGGAMSAAGQAAASAGQAAGNIEASRPGAVSDVVGNVTTRVQDRAQTLVNQAQDSVQSGEAEQRARSAADKTAKAVSGTSWGIVGLMLLGLLSGIWGAIWGGRRIVRV